MAWNEPGGNGDKDPWGNRGNQGPPDLDEVFKNFQRKFGSLFGGRGGRGGQALADLEDRLGADINKLSDELNADLEQFKKEREQERETRTAELVEAQQASEAAFSTRLRR